MKKGEMGLMRYTMIEDMRRYNRTTTTHLVQMLCLISVVSCDCMHFMIERSLQRNFLVFWRPVHQKQSSYIDVLCLRSGGFDLNNSSNNILRPLQPMSINAAKPEQDKKKETQKGTLVQRNHWSSKISQLRESIWETQKSLGLALVHLRKRSLERQENETDDGQFYYYDTFDDDLQEESENGDGERFNHLEYKFSARTEPTRGSLDDILDLTSPKLPLEEWGFFAMSSFLSLITCVYCYQMVSQNLHWDWSIQWQEFNMYSHYISRYNVLEWFRQVAPDLLCLLAGTAGMLCGLYATCSYTLLAFHGRQLAIQHQWNNPLYHFRTQALVEDYLQRTSRVRARGFRAFRVSVYTLGMQIPLLITFRLPAVLPLRVVVVALLSLTVWKILGDAQSVLLQPSASTEKNDPSDASASTNFLGQRNYLG